MSAPTDRAECCCSDCGEDTCAQNPLCDKHGDRYPECPVHGDEDDG
jgi:hypothetical protein